MNVNVKKKKGIIVAGIIMAIIAIVIGIIIFQKINSPSYVVGNAFKKFDVKGIVSYVDENKDNQEKMKLLSEEIDSSFEKSMKQYNEGKVKYDKIHKFFEEIIGINIQGTSFGHFRDDLEKLSESKYSYKLAEKALKEKKLCEAILNYNKVDEIDSNYKDACDKITKNYDQYIKELYAQLDTKMNNHKYADALQDIKDAKSLKGSANDVLDAWTSKIEKHEDMYKTREEGLKIKNAKRGDHVTFGDTSWIVVIAEKKWAYLITESTIGETRKYDSDAYIYRWKECELREWLNGPYYDMTFTDEEKKLISKTKTGSVEDNVTCMTTTQADVLLDRLQRKAAQFWWLQDAYHVDPDGIVSHNNSGMGGGSYASETSNISVRPCISIDLEKVK